MSVVLSVIFDLMPLLLLPLALLFVHLLIALLRILAWTSVSPRFIVCIPSAIFAILRIPPIPRPGPFVSSVVPVSSSLPLVVVVVLTVLAAAVIVMPAATCISDLPCRPALVLAVPVRLAAASRATSGILVALLRLRLFLLLPQSLQCLLLTLKVLLHGLNFSSQVSENSLLGLSNDGFGEESHVRSINSCSFGYYHIELIAVVVGRTRFNHRDVHLGKE